MKAKQPGCRARLYSAQFNNDLTPMFIVVLSIHHSSHHHGHSAH